MRKIDPANDKMAPDVPQFKSTAADASAPKGLSAIELPFFFDLTGAGAAAGAGGPKISIGRSTLSTSYTTSWSSEYTDCLSFGTELARRGKEAHGIGSMQLAADP